MVRLLALLPLSVAFWIRSATASTFGVGDMVPQAFHRQPAPRMDIHAPNMEVEDMVMALRWTGEMNRRLQVNMKSKRQDLIDHSYSPREQRAMDPLRGGQSTPFRVASTNDADFSALLTIFHASKLRSSPEGTSVLRGAARWGPDLDKFLAQLVQILQQDSATADTDSFSLELALAMIYMDRACSVETPRSNGLQPCPFCTPRTVHRLTVAALLVAVESVRGSSERERLLPKVSDDLDIPEHQLRHMVEWTLGALGDPGFFVDPFQMQEFTQTWERRFCRHSGYSIEDTDDVPAPQLESSSTMYPGEMQRTYEGHYDERSHPIHV